MFIKNTNQKGQSLFEILFALAIMAMIGVAVVSLSVSAVRNNIYANNKTLANKYTMEGQEWIRNKRDNNYHDIWTRGGAYDSQPKAYCLSDLNDTNWFNDPPTYKEKDGEIDYNQMFGTGGNQCSTPILGESNIYRLIIMQRTDLSPTLMHLTNVDESIRVLVVVHWTDGQGDHNAVAETYLTEWKSQKW